MDRRKFLGSMAVLGVQGVMAEAAVVDSIKKMPVWASRRKKKDLGIDENLVAVISDLHTNPDGYQPDRLRRVISDILALNPRPRNVIALGDLAYLKGKPAEYALLKEIVAPLEPAGIRLTMTMGNHDRRKRFAEAFPEMAAASLMDDRYVYVVETPRADIILMDSLQEDPDPEKGIVAGALTVEEKEWLKARLATYTDKPVFVTAHHPIGETGIRDILVNSPTCSGYIHGHDHVWRDGWVKKNYSVRNLVRTLCVPSTGHWGDIGYTLLRFEEDHAEAQIQEYEFFFPKPAEEGEPIPAQWKMIEQEHRGRICYFDYRK